MEIKTTRIEGLQSKALFMYNVRLVSLLKKRRKTKIQCRQISKFLCGSRARKLKMAREGGSESVCACASVCTRTGCKYTHTYPDSSSVIQMQFYGSAFGASIKGIRKQV